MLVPQGRFTRFLGTVTGSYVKRVDVGATGDNYRARGMHVLNMDASIVVTVSFDGGVTDHVELDPADSPSITLDNFHPPNGTIHIKSATGTPRVQVACWG